MLISVIIPVYNEEKTIVEILNKINNLNIWKSDKYNGVNQGFIAHEVQSVIPQAVMGDKDALDKDKNPSYQMLDNSKLVPLLVKTIQELEARLTALENE